MACWFDSNSQWIKIEFKKFCSWSVAALDECSVTNCLNGWKESDINSGNKTQKGLHKYMGEIEVGWLGYSSLHGANSSTNHGVLPKNRSLL